MPKTLRNRVEEISTEWSDEVKYLSDSERTEIDENISQEMDSFRETFHAQEAVSYAEASKIQIPGLQEKA